MLLGQTGSPKDEGYLLGHLLFFHALGLLQPCYFNPEMLRLPIFWIQFSLCPLTSVLGETVEAQLPPSSQGSTISSCSFPAPMPKCPPLTLLDGRELFLISKG